MIHPCCQPFHILPAERPDQLFHAVIKIRKTKPMKASSYCTKFQIHEKSGTLNRIDTCSIKNDGKLYFTPKLSSGIETSSIWNWPNINASLSELVQKNILSRYGANLRRKWQIRYATNIGYDKSVNVETYVYGSLIN